MPDRYCIKEERFEKVIEHKTTWRFIRTWLFTYSDGTTEQLKTTEKFKK